MSGGLIALLDDVAAIAKVAAATLDDVATQTVKVGGKAAGIVVDDTAVTPRYVVGFAASRELPIVWKIAKGSLRNKLLFLLPAALLLSALAPWAITPLLMAGGAFLCFEGAEKLLHMLHPHEEHVAAEAAPDADPRALEDEKVAGAIRTDMILSAEIMAIALAAIEAPDLLTRAFVLAAVGIAITVGVYGVVAMIVKADDVGAALARGRSAALRAVGRGLVLGMPHLLSALSLIGTLAMLWVGGQIVLHGLASFGFAGPEHAIDAVAHAFGAVAPAVEGLLSWLVGAGLSAVVGFGIGVGVLRAVALAKRLAPRAA